MFKSTSFAILLAGAMIASSVLAGSRWQITQSGETVFRLDRWQGVVEFCRPKLNAARDARFVVCEDLPVVRR
jgi:hypothetical protein